jgi:hypothetical protein
MNGLRLFGNHCISFYRRTQLGERLTHFHSRSLAYDYCGLGALANGTRISRREASAASEAVGWMRLLGDFLMATFWRTANF